ncbi:sensor histidine kinase [Luteimonas mephitis]|uniref:sensor histidine kinase n=1 Tax=Luteimonas mephitis TaxID=83615 RepID=UPI0003F61754|nr:histidine kinase [Luteimonas mephitis]
MPPSSPSNPLESLWRPTALITILLAGEALALILTLAPGGQGDRLVRFGLASLGIQWIALGTLGAIYLSRRQLARLSAPAMAWACLGLLLALTAIVAVGAWQVLELAMDPASSGVQFVLQLLAMALVVGLLALVAFQNYLHAQQLLLRAKQLELEALQARIQPHFLFNTLNTGAALVHARPDEAERVLLDLADLFRCALRGPQHIPLADELALTQRYLDIESLRFGERLRLEWDVPDTLPDVQVPSLSIQPLAENAIRHGIERLPQGGRVDVSVQVSASEVVVSVGNDMPSLAGGNGGHAVGLSSARERVDALTEGRGRVEARVEDGRHLVRMVLPLG